MKYLACQPSRLSKQSTTSSMAYSLLMTGFTQPDSMPATIAAFKFDSRNKKEEARIGKWTPTPISAHSDGLVVPKATPQMLAYDQRYLAVEGRTRHKIEKRTSGIMRCLGLMLTPPLQPTTITLWNIVIQGTIKIRMVRRVLIFWGKGPLQLMLNSTHFQKAHKFCDRMPLLHFATSIIQPGLLGFRKLLSLDQWFTLLVV